MHDRMYKVIRYNLKYNFTYIFKTISSSTIKLPLFLR